MDCHEAREYLLESYAEPQLEAKQADLEAHMALCETCRCFFETQLQLDSLLSRQISPPPLNSRFRSSVMEKARREPCSIWHEFLPDKAHLLGGICATALSLPLLPFPATSILLAGAAFTLATYFVQSLIRGSLELWEEGQQ
jgi:hypothetical protein